MEIAALMLGLSVGSFLAAYTYRRQKGLSVRRGRSFCPHCKAKIAWYDNIPLISFVALKGRCRACHKKISVRYPLIELLTAVSFVFYLRFFNACSVYFSGNTLCTLKEASPFLSLGLVLILISVLIAIIVIDLESKIIPDELTFWAISIVVAFYILTTPSLVLSRLFVGFCAAVFFLLIHLFTRGRGMGLGDVKFVILGGLILGGAQTLVWLFTAFLTGAVLGTILILAGKAKLGREIAFGPYLGGTLLLTILFGEKILALYLG